MHDFRFRDFRFWCQKVLPLVYDDSLSYYEVLCKVRDYINKILENEDNLNSGLLELKEYVDDYFNTLNVREEIESVLDQMLEDGDFNELLGQWTAITTGEIDLILEEYYD